MLLQLNTPPAVEPVTLAEVLQQCRLDIVAPVLSSGALTIGQWYEIVSCVANYFYSGCAPGDTFQATVATALDANDTVQLIEEGALLSSYALAAREYVEQMCGPLITQTWDQFESHFPSEFHWWRFGISDWATLGEIQPLGTGRRHLLRGFTLNRPHVQSITSITYTDYTNTQYVVPPTTYTLVQENFRSHIVLQRGQEWPNVELQRGNSVDIRFVCGYGGTSSVIPEPIRRAILLLVSQWYEHREPILTEKSMAQLPYAVEALLANYRWEGF